jgi:ATP-dependent DNA ligase
MSGGGQDRFIYVIGGHRSQPVRRIVMRGCRKMQVQPIAPVRRTEPFDDPEWLFDLKYDGFRALCYLEQGAAV